MVETPTYDTIAAAEAALTQNGFTRDVQQAVWVHPSLRERAKVVRTEGAKFILQKA